MAKTEQSLLSTPLHGLYIPAGLLVFGTAIVQREYVPYSIALAAILVAFKIYRGRKCRSLFDELLLTMVENRGLFSSPSNTKNLSSRRRPS